MKERYMKDLLDIRKDIDKIDEQIVKLYEERMKLTSDVAEYKINTGKQIFDKEREESKLATLQKKAESEETPWYDRYDSEHGYVKYYGDNKPNKGRPENAPGNKIIHDKVYTTYTVFDAAGNRYVQIDTYGKIDRENPEKISQSIQFDKQTAEFFVDLLKKEFDI